MVIWLINVVSNIKCIKAIHDLEDCLVVETLNYNIIIVEHHVTINLLQNLWKSNTVLTGGYLQIYTHTKLEL